jgi:hypothetical protein
MIPDVQRSAMAIITLPIISLPVLALPSSPPEEATITHHTRIPPKHTRRITVVIILVSAPISLGKAVVSTHSPVLIHFPTNGTKVLSFTPQHTQGFVHFSHLLSHGNELFRWLFSAPVRASQVFLASSSLVSGVCAVSAAGAGSVSTIAGHVTHIFQSVSN